MVKADPTITQCQVNGERNCGTNFIKRLFANNLPAVKPIGYLSNTSPFGWKHGDLDEPWGLINSDGELEFQTIRDYKTESGETLFVVVDRNPISWLQSTHLSPHHAPELQNLSFSKFIRSPWRSYYSKIGEDASQDENVRLATIKPENKFEDYKSIFELRSKKQALFAGFPKRVRYVCYLRYEDVIADPEAVLAVVADSYQLKLAAKFKPVVEDKFGFSNYKPRQYAGINLFDALYIRRNLDWKSEAKHGYRPRRIFLNRRFLRCLIKGWQAADLVKLDPKGVECFSQGHPL